VAESSSPKAGAGVAEPLMAEFDEVHERADRRELRVPSASVEAFDVVATDSTGV
jgi:hypothetical protein